jgi:hypothetical protein
MAREMEKLNGKGGPESYFLLNLSFYILNLSFITTLLDPATFRVIRWKRKVII